MSDDHARHRHDRLDRIGRSGVLIVRGDRAALLVRDYRARLAEQALLDSVASFEAEGWLNDLRYVPRFLEHA